MNTSGNRWTDVFNIFLPYWTISAAPTETGPAGINAMQAYVEHDDIRPLENVVRSMRPELHEHARVVIVGQRGTGKTMDLTWIARQLARTYVVLWLDAVGLDSQILQDPLNLFAVIGLAAAQSAARFGERVDPEYISNLLSASQQILTQEASLKEIANIRLEKILDGVGTWFSQISLPLAASGAPGPAIFVATVGSVFKIFAQSAELGIESQDVQRQTTTTMPRIEEAALRLRLLVQKVEELTGKPVVVIVDGLDRVPLAEIKRLSQRARALASPDLRLILTAPLALYHAPEFTELEDFFPGVLVRPNVNRAIGRADEFLHNIIAQRLTLCELDQSRIFETGALALLIEASGGNIRQLIMLVREAAMETEYRGLIRIEIPAAEVARHRIQVNLVERLQRPGFLKALQAFTQAMPQQPPDGEIGDMLLGMNCIMAHRDAGGLPIYALNPLVQAYLQERNWI